MNKILPINKRVRRSNKGPGQDQTTLFGRCEGSGSPPNLYQWWSCGGRQARSAHPTQKYEEILRNAFVRKWCVAALVIHGSACPWEGASADAITETALPLQEMSGNLQFL